MPMMIMKFSTSWRWVQLLLGLVLLVHIKCNCTFPGRELTNGQYIYSKKVAKPEIAPELYILRFRCSTGYERIGPRHIQCVNGKWSDTVPVCTRMTCGYPPSIANGAYEIEGGNSIPPVIGTFVTYYCNNGYQMTGFKNSTCFRLTENYAAWIGRPPSCARKVTCRDPGVSKHGTRFGNCCHPGDMIEFSCDEGFELIGVEEITCLPSRLWSHDRPLCRPMVYCDLPPWIPRGEVTGDKEGDYFQPYDEVEIVCDLGYSQNRSTMFVMCQEDGKWEAEFGECTVKQCDRPEPLVNGTILDLESTDLSSFPYKSELNYVCDSGYRLVGGDSWRICRPSGWSGRTPYCEEMSCSDPGVPENGDREGNTFLLGATVRFRCFVGYYQLGSFERICMSNGLWSGELSSCDTSSNYCPNPGIPINGFKNSSRYGNGDKVGFSCRSGFVHVGSKARVCMPNRTWSGVETKCLSPRAYNTDQVNEISKVKVEELFDDEVRKKRCRQAPSAQRLFEECRTHKERLILYFAFDVSDTVGIHNFRKSIDFAKTIVSRVGVSQDGTRVGALTFRSVNATTPQMLPMHLNETDDVLNSFDRIPYREKNFVHSSMLSKISDFISLQKYIIRGKTKTVVFIITDGQVKMDENLVAEARILKMRATDIYCIGITDDVQMDLLYKIASISRYHDVERPNVFMLQDYVEFPWLIHQITYGTVDYSECGFRNGDVILHKRDRILNGKKSDEPWPWTVAIYSLNPRTKDAKDSKLICGGTIINENFILTAAQCMFEENMTAIYTGNNIYRLRGKEEIIVKLGLTYSIYYGRTLVHDFNVKTIHLHPTYTRGPSFDYDIALLELDRPIIYGPYVRSICLPPKELPPKSNLYNSNSLGWATGWGNVEIVDSPEDGIFNTKEILLPIQSREKCEKSLNENHYNSSYFTDRMFCAGDGQTGNDPCRGESGGPLMQPQLNKEGYLYWTQVGIFSWGIGCGYKDMHGYYTHVHNLMPWIEEKTQAPSAATGG